MSRCKSRNLASNSKESLGSCAITLRIPRVWLKKLDRLVPRMSEQHERMLNRQDLIRESVRKTFFEKTERWNLLKRTDGLSYHDQLRVMEKLSRGESLANDELVMSDNELSVSAMRQVLYLVQPKSSRES